MKLFVIYDKATKKYVADRNHVEAGQFFSGFLVDASGSLYEVTMGGVMKARDRFELQFTEDRK